MNPTATVILPLAVEYRCVSLECSYCGIRVHEGITTEMIYAGHGDHLERVTLQIEIQGSGKTWELQPLPPAKA